MENLYGAWGNGVEAYLRKDYATAERCFKIDAFNQALEYDDWMAISYFQKGACYFMLGMYDEAIKSWNDAKENIRHGEVVDYDSLHLSYMLCKSEIALNVAIAFYYADMTEECNVMLDEARGYTIVKDDIPTITQQMIAGEEVYPCTVDDSILFNPPKLPQSVVDAMKKGASSAPSWGGGSVSSSPPVPSYAASNAYSSPSPSSTPPSMAPKLAPPARSAPVAPAKKGPGGPPAPPPPPKKAPKKGFGKMAPKKGPGAGPASVKVAMSSSPPPVAAFKSPVSAPPAFSPSSPAGGGAPPPPPIPAGGIPQKTIPSSGPTVSSPASRSQPAGPPLPFSADNLQAALAKRSGSAASSPSSATPASGPPRTAAPTSLRFGPKAPAAASTSAPTTPTGPGSLKLPVRAPPKTPSPTPPSILTSSNGNSPGFSPAPTSPRGGTAEGGSFSFKVLAEQGARKKKIETTVATPVELRETITQNFGVDASTLVEHYDPDFGEFVELDNAVNLSTLPTMLKVRLAGP